MSNGVKEIMDAMIKMTEDEFARTTNDVRRFLVEKSNSGMSQADYDAQYEKLCNERAFVEHKLGNLVGAGEMANVRPRDFLKALSIDCDEL